MASSGETIEKIYSNAISVQCTSTIQGYHHALSPENENQELTAELGKSCLRQVEVLLGIAKKVVSQVF